MNYCIQDYFVINSEDTFFTFNLNVKNTLSYKMYDNNINIIDENILRKKDVLKFSITMDDKDNIHILYLLDSGSLYLKTYDNKSWKDTFIGKFNSESNKYYQLELFFINGKFHIIYGYSNLINTNICAIGHIIYKENIEQRHNVIRYVSMKKEPRFSVDYDFSGTIHILYNTITNTKSYIYHCFYSPYRKSWSNNPKSLWEGLNSSFCYLFIDKTNSIHSIWIEEEEKNNKNKLLYKKMNTKGRDQYIWRDIYLNNLFPSKNMPFTLYEKDKTLYISFVKDEKIIIFKSIDYGNCWVKENESKYSNISIIKIIVNKNLKVNLKVNHIIGDSKNIFNLIHIKNLFHNILSNQKKSESLYIKDNINLIVEKNKPEKLLQDLNLIENKDCEEDIIKDIFINNISNFEDPDFSYIEDNINIDKNTKQLELEIDKIKSQIHQILNSQLSLEKKINTLLDKGDSFETEIIKIKEEINKLPVPIMKKIFG